MVAQIQSGEDDSAQLTLCILKEHNTTHHFEMGRLSRDTKIPQGSEHAALFFNSEDQKD